ncbi:hypothetical protein DUNSADRAFT_8441 [Dunaliella salina]|uniref:Uncharacterized protein n=1 Tax=Dunaliella salina TaxID=3046 RepID=A0ABQ7GJL6_DUNSA|nr:hypothetical protein DUNSADRAFT_8441 [Dunaliella salina]|eukprot:KAF5834800.1 hypothetical protein DUNSADRAFT_8441 [Dunaliella salina]
MQEAQNSSSLAPEVIEFEEFLAKHGETGGWHPDDHAEFVNILKACGGDYTHAVKVTLENCMGYSQRDVILHSRCTKELSLGIYFGCVLVSGKGPARCQLTLQAH